MKINSPPSNDQGFTIIELMIATVAFSIVLLILTFGIIQITNVYYKGVTITTTQNVLRDIANDISQSIEFSGAQVTGQTDLTNPTQAGTTQAFCIGTTGYLYQLGYEVETNPGSNQAYHGLVVINDDPNCPYNPSAGSYSLRTSSSIPTGGQEILDTGMRLSKLIVTENPIVSGLYNIDIQVTYGDDSFLNHPNSINGLTPTSNVSCILSVGDQFCDIAELNSAVEMRLQ
jgi:prepilin-type N-terminal cleavage/methylation domain-containing protein